MNWRKQILLIIILIAVGVAGRLVPHPWNFTPIFGVSLLATSRLGTKGLIVPVVSMIITDFFIGWYSWPLMLVVYGSFALGSCLGLVLKRSDSLVNPALAAVVASTLFFLTTNAAVWLGSPLYPPSMSGLMMSYVAGVPFYKAMLLGDVVFTVGLFSLARLVATALLFLGKLRVVDHTSPVAHS